MADQTSALLSRDEIVARYNIPKRFLECAAARGDGPPFIRLSRNIIRYRVQDLEQWIETRTVRAEITL